MRCCARWSNSQQGHFTFSHRWKATMARYWSGWNFSNQMVSTESEGAALYDENGILNFQRLWPRRQQLWPSWNQNVRWNQKCCCLLRACFLAIYKPWVTFCRRGKKCVDRRVFCVIFTGTVWGDPEMRRRAKRALTIALINFCLTVALTCWRNKIRSQSVFFSHSFFSTSCHPWKMLHCVPATQQNSACELSLTTILTKEIILFVIHLLCEGNLLFSVKLWQWRPFYGNGVR